MTENKYFTGTLVSRLLGKYEMGPHLPNGKPEFGIRQFETTPICIEAAMAIQKMEELLAEIRLISKNGYGSDHIICHNCVDIDRLIDRFEKDCSQDFGEGDPNKET